VLRAAPVKILVTVTRVPDPEQKPKFRGAEFDRSGVNWVLNPFDEYAVETALRLTEKAPAGERLGEVVVLSIGPREAAQQIRSCLAMGADRALLVVHDAELDSSGVARCVAKVWEAERPDLLLMGKQAVDGDSNQVGQFAAGLLGLPQACFAATIEVVDGGRALVVGREVDGGLEQKKVALPAVVTVDLRIVLAHAVNNGVTPADRPYSDGPRYASLKGIMAAKKKELREVAPADLGLDLAPRVRVLAVSAPPGRKAGVKVKNAAELVARLRDEAKVL
jgi:electron transfer flavoprotein beta subunit